MVSLEEPSVGLSVGPLQIQNPDSTVRNEVYSSVIDAFISTGVGKKLRIIVVGEAGQGKSTLINALVGEEVANEGDGFKSGTNSVQPYNIHQNGVEFGIWDTPGFGMGEEDEEIVEQLKRSDCFPADLVLFCIRMDAMRIPTRVHITTIKTLTKVFSEKFWKHALFVLTFANNVTQLCPAGEQLEYFFSQRCITIEKEFQEAVGKYTGLSPEELEGIRAVPVGSCKTGIIPDNPWMLPDREDWFLCFWMDVANRMSQSALSTLLQGNRHRLVSDAHTSPSPDVELPYQRKLEATPDEIETVEKELKDIEASVKDIAACTSLGPSEIEFVSSYKTKVPDRTDTAMDRPRVDDKPKDDTMDKGNVDDNPDAASKGGGNNAADGGGKPSPTQNGGGNNGGRPGEPKIPIFIILLQQLEKDNSGFRTFLRKFAEKRGEELKLIGHFGGLLEGFVTYLSRDKKQIKR